MPPCKNDISTRLLCEIAPGTLTPRYQGEAKLLPIPSLKQRVGVVYSGSGSFYHHKKMTSLPFPLEYLQSPEKLRHVMQCFTNRKIENNS